MDFDIEQDSPESNSGQKKPKIQKQPAAKIFKLTIHPLFLVGVVVITFLIFSFWLGSGSTSQQVSLDTLIRDFKANKYSSIEIRDSGEIVAKAKYILISSSKGLDIPNSGVNGTETASNIKTIQLNELIDKLQPKDAITQIKNIVASSQADVFAEIVIGPDFILAVNKDLKKDSYIVKSSGESEFIAALAERNLSYKDLDFTVSPIRTAGSEITQASFAERLKNDTFSEVYQLGDFVYGRIDPNKEQTFSLNWDGGFKSFIDTLQQEGISLSDNNSVIVTFPVATVPWGDIISLLTLVGFVVLGFVLFRGIQSSGSGLMRFGQSKARMFWGIKPDITFADIAGVDEAKEELNEIVMFLKHPGKFRKLGARIPKGVLMVGAPGTGKTLMARAIAGEAGVPFFHTSGSEFEEMLVGAGASRVRDLFEKAKKASPSLIFIDEIDAVARKRGTTIQSSTTEQTLNQILVEMDGFEQSINVIVIAATNRPDVLDPAILRPGRFDRRVVLELPDAEGREQILKIHSANKPLAKNVDLSRVAKRTIGFSGAELENTLNEAAIIAAKREAKELDYKDIEEAASKVMMGPAKRSRQRDDYTLKLVAYHEAGHAVVSKFVPQANPVHRVSIIARGGAGGVTEFLPLDENQITSRTKLLSSLAVALGGRAAEEVFLGDISTGASNDISQATTVARNMVQKFGMSEKLGMIKYGDSQDLEHLGYSYGENRDFSEDTATQIDNEVRALVDEAYQRAVDILKEHKAIVEILKDYLLDKEVIEADEFDKLFAGVKGATQPITERRLEDKKE
jgi:cell division protease FtsH